MKSVNFHRRTFWNLGGIEIAGVVTGAPLEEANE